MRVTKKQQRLNILQTLEYSDAEVEWAKGVLKDAMANRQNVLARLDAHDSGSDFVPHVRVKFRSSGYGCDSCGTLMGVECYKGCPNREHRS